MYRYVGGAHCGALSLGAGADGRHRQHRKSRDSQRLDIVLTRIIEGTEASNSLRPRNYSYYCKQDFTYCKGD
jgi:hypothetical protein